MTPTHLHIQTCVNTHIHVKSFGTGMSNTELNADTGVETLIT